MASHSPVHELEPSESWERLKTHHLGRLVTVVGGAAEIFPVNYVIDDDSIVFRTAEGSKLVELTINDSVLFEVDDYSTENVWSVVVRGRAVRVVSPEESSALDALALVPMIPTVKRNYVRITPERLTGRAFRQAPEPDRDSVDDG
ncbi:MAG: pyridoxamine 5'-phosphate oxidase family protein [Leucobacter sp.]